MTRWIIDGMNVIGSRPTGWWRDRPRAMRQLVHELEAFTADTGEDVTVVLDGKPFELDSEGVDVRFASRRGPNAADDDIAALVERDEDASRLVVVTSDADLARRARDAGATVVGAGEFRRRLDSI
jgi:predicted RNA-binding protein with PIN domain